MIAKNLTVSWPEFNVFDRKKEPSYAKNEKVVLIFRAAFLFLLMRTQIS